MKREITFRAWDKFLNRMYFDTEYLMVCHDKIFYKYDGTDFKISVSNCDFMQSTGLKDKNGKEIYEGDIIQYKLLRSDGDTVIITCQIAKSKYGWYPFTDECYCMDNAIDIKVIGNINENPELIETKEAESSEPKVE